MNFSNVLKIKNNNLDILLGYDAFKNFLTINLNNIPNILITGSTGTSKSILLNQILTQLTKKNEPQDLKIICLSKTKVELQEYAESNYSYFKFLSPSLDQILTIINKRRVDYESDEWKKQPYLIIAIDEASDILNSKKESKKLKEIVSLCHDIDTSIIINTNNVYNDFFDKDFNLLFSCRISYDFVSHEDSKQNNLENSESLHLLEFNAEINNQTKPKKYTSFYHDI